MRAHGSLVQNAGKRKVGVISSRHSGAARRAEPGIHDNDNLWLEVIVGRSTYNDGPWLWIPGSRFARPGMTASGRHHRA